MVPIRTLLAWTGAALIGLGLLVGLALPVHAEGVTCGTALHATDAASSADLLDTLAGNSPRTGAVGGVEAACDSARNTPRLITVVLIGLGIVAGVAAVIVKPSRRRMSGLPENLAR